MIGSGVMRGMHGILPGIGDTTPDGGTHTLVGVMIGIGITVMLSTIITTGAPSVTFANRAAVIRSCVRV